jgi:hypothetical protein
MTLTKACFTCEAVSETAGAFCPSCGSTYGVSPPPSNSGPAMAPACAILLLIFGFLAVAGTFMAYFVYDNIPFSGWESQDATRYYDLYSSGALMSAIFGAVVALTGISGFTRHLISSRPVKKSDRITVGIMLIVAAVLMIGNAGATYNAIDETAMLDVVYVEIGVGLYLQFLAGLATGVLGVVLLAVKAAMPEQGSVKT